MAPETLCMGCMQDRGTALKCPHCGWQERDAAESPLQLAPRTVLHGCYLVGRALGQGGFGITYLAWDLNLDRKLAIKEYFPRDLCVRSRDECTVQALTQNVRDSYQDGLEKFLEEGKTLARFQDNPGIVPVLTFFRENGTAYIVMSYIEGETFKQYLEEHGGKLPFDTAVAMLSPLMDTLKEVHAVGMLHRDISPDNMYVTRSGQMKLLDFGNARFAIGEQSRSLDVILKPGYAPYEQYRSRGKQGPWTDVYALSATLYRAITGQTPSPAPDRMAHDDLVPPSRLGVAIPAQAESALFAALALRQEERPQSVVEFKSALLQGVDITVPAPPHPSPRPQRPSPPPVSPPPSPPPPPGRWKAIVVGAAGVLIAGLLVWLFWPRPKPGHLKITASVDGSQVADGVQVGVNGPKRAACAVPCDLGLPAGDYDVVGRKPGFADVAQRTTLAAGKESSINLPFESPKQAPPASGRLEVRANVEGAQITINEHQTDCVTPCAFNLPFGDYRVTGAKQGYRGDQQTVTLAEDQNPTVNLNLTRLGGPPPPPRKGPSVRDLIAQGESNLMSHQYDSATDALRQAITLGASDAEKARAYGDLCLALGSGKRYPDASQACRTAIGLNPNDARTHSELGVALANLGDWGGADAQDRAALKLDPANARLHYNLAITLNAEGKQAAAAEERKKAHQLDPQRYTQ